VIYIFSLRTFVFSFSLIGLFKLESLEPHTWYIWAPGWSCGGCQGLVVAKLQDRGWI